LFHLEAEEVGKIARCFETSIAASAERTVLGSFSAELAVAGLHRVAAGIVEARGAVAVVEIACRVQAGSQA
jgi:hypothetical protein